MQRGPYKAQTLSLLNERGVPVNFILDVGVLNGTPELMSAYPNKKHYLFEPVAEYEEKIKVAYQCFDYQLIKAAMTDFNGSVNLQLFNKFNDQEISHSSMYFSDVTPDLIIREVPALRLDTFVFNNNLQGQFPLKLDIDGHEIKALRGAQNILKSCSVIIIECSRNFFVERISEVIKNGFKLFDITEPCYYDDAFWQCDAVFIRNDIFDEIFLELSNKVVPGKFQIFR